MESTLHVDPATEQYFPERPHRSDQYSHGVSWSAVIGGALVAAAIALIMLALGAGFGLSTISPWSNAGAWAAVGAGAITWLIVTQVVAYAMGGYLAGRLRTRWVSVHTDEVYFRDTANGFLVWAVAVVITVTFLVSSAATMVGQREAAKAPVDPGGYFVDRLLRADVPQPADAALQAEAGRALAHTLRQDDHSGADEAYLARLVAAKTGMNQADSKQRVSDVTAEARQAEDNARQAASHLLLWIFLALLIGAFSASYAATIGGRQRDHVKAI